MRREQVHKVCCNHAITKDMQLQPMHTSETSWCWFAVDYTEYEPTNEQFAVKFKVKAMLTHYTLLILIVNAQVILLIILTLYVGCTKWSVK